MTKDILKTLNPEQKKAVITTEGPVLIIAGAGTGKTRVITARIAHLLASKKDLKPENILALTFTEKATNEMGQRVSGIIGHKGDDVWVYTFHSFCRKVLADDGSHIGISGNFKILNDVEKWIFLKRLLPEFKLKYYMHQADPASVISSFSKFISRAKDELILPEEYSSYAEKLRKEFEKSKEKYPADERKARELEVKREEEVARIYSIYQRATVKNNMLDFGDLIIYTMKLFNERPNVLGHYREQFKYILVDEFQDTNIAQIELLDVLAGKRKNICVVGDDDQAIYRFRGASYASFLKFKEKYRNLVTVTLSQNYRSSKKILSAAGRLISNNGADRYDPGKELWTKNPAGEKVQAIVAYDYTEEARAVADKIEKIYSKMPDKNYSAITVLYRAHSHKELLLNELNARRIPATVVRGAGLFKREEIRDLLSYMRLLDNPDDSVSLFRVLTSNAWNLDIEDLIHISGVAVREEKSIYNLLRDLDVLDGISDDTREKISGFMAHIKEFLRTSRREDVAELFRSLLLEYVKRTQLISGGDPEKDRKVVNISALNSFIMRYIKNNSDWSLSAFLDYLDCFIEAGGDRGQENISISENAVQLMTIHAAKGLEFPYVFLISLVRNRFPTIRRKEPIPFPDRLIKEKLPSGDFHREEERRLCYVGATRAQKGLYISSVSNASRKQSVFLKEMFTDEAMDCGDAAIMEIPLREDLSGRAEVFIDRFRKAEEDKHIAHKLPKPKKMSFSQISTYLKCPMQYKFAYIYRIPGRKKAFLTFGSVVHSSLEEFFKLVQERKKVSEKTLLDLYSRHWTPSGYESRMQESSYRKSGKESLQEFFKSNKDILERPPLYLEKKLDLKIADCVLDVRIDRIDAIGGNNVEIIDYKTGKVPSKKKPNESLQLDIYAMACRDVLELNPKVLSFYYVGPNKKVSTTRTDKELDKSKETVLEAAGLIKAEEFKPKPGMMCKWCDYLALCPAYDKR